MCVPVCLLMTDSIEYRYICDVEHAPLQFQYGFDPSSLYGFLDKSVL